MPNPSESLHNGAPTVSPQHWPVVQTERRALRNVVRVSPRPQSLLTIQQGLPSTWNRRHRTCVISVPWNPLHALGMHTFSAWPPHHLPASSLRWKLPPESARGPTLGSRFADLLLRDPGYSAKPSFPRVVTIHGSCLAHLSS